MSRAFLIAARRLAVTPRGGALAGFEAHELAAGPIRAVLADVGISAAQVDEVILGNALYGGGNPARLAALAAGVPEAIPALTLDTQCCAGLDAILAAVTRVRAREADLIVAGGVESYSRAPMRIRPPKGPDDAPQPYDRPPFTPWPGQDPDMIPAAAALAEDLAIRRADQEAFAMASHGKALSAPPSDEIVPLGGVAQDTFSRRLTPALCRRLPVLAGDTAHGVTAATVAVEADSAAVVLVASASIAKHIDGTVLEVVGGARAGGDPGRPGLALVPAVRRLLDRQAVMVSELSGVEIMEAFAVQAMAAMAALGLNPALVNRGGGALARGHPIGASGAILAVRLWYEMARLRAGGFGLAAIAAAGGLGSALLLRSSGDRHG
ncbi:acetyl-CoA C-acyltransferase [Microvirga sp. VF16]|uniref:acetyl-CoA C-acyltransferase n=1 Tax=Microvirga sp. VF16 TaxID=2807101 RepID=UPI00193D1A34|nr:acetyl-CoA C-acyltransferase [Microvirga sp. VF16]QRM33139.1 acetyl-CoA C-acyltransferase [Microvirga sp. VF16]